MLLSMSDEGLDNGWNVTFINQQSWISSRVSVVPFSNLLAFLIFDCTPSSVGRTPLFNIFSINVQTAESLCPSKKEKRLYCCLDNTNGLHKYCSVLRKHSRVGQTLHIILAIASEKALERRYRDLKQLLGTTAGKSCQKAFDNIWDVFVVICSSGGVAWLLVRIPMLFLEH